MIPSQVHKTFYVVYTFKCYIVLEKEAFWSENDLRFSNMNSGGIFSRKNKVISPQQSERPLQLKPLLKSFADLSSRQGQSSNNPVVILWMSTDLVGGSCHRGKDSLAVPYPYILKKRELWRTSHRLYSDCIQMSFLVIARSVKLQDKAKQSELCHSVASVIPVVPGQQLFCPEQTTWKKIIQQSGIGLHGSHQH